MVVGPDWKGEEPPGIAKFFRSSPQFSRAAFRTQPFNAADLDEVKAAKPGK